MSTIQCRRLVILLLCGSLAPTLLSQSAAQTSISDSSLPAESKPPSDATYPQIVRIRSLEGDVRVMRGNAGEKASGSTWEQAVAGLPLATGFSLVTGQGRAEIEFEDASTVYLAENSALTFNDIHITAGMPYTQIALLSGTATLHVEPGVEQFFRLLTPTGSILARYPGGTYLRVTSFADGTEIAFRTDMQVRASETPSRIVSYTKGQTILNQIGRPVTVMPAKTPDPMAAWDAWVDERVKERTQAEAEMMKASGLTAPIPGLADMAGQGSFFPCAPYGTCWEPNALRNAEQPGETNATQAAVMPGAPTMPPAAAQPPIQTVVAQTQEKPAAPEPAVAGQKPGEAPPGHLMERYERLETAPCLPDVVRSLIERDPATGKERVIWSGVESEPGAEFGSVNAASRVRPGLYYGFGNPWDWAVCHAGFWIYRGNHYVWVVGHKRHHRPPIRWVKQGGKTAFVPLHPRDVTGKRPENLRHVAFVVSNRGRTVERTMLDSGREIKMLESPPKEFTKPYLEPLARAADPHVEVHRVNEPLLASRGTAPTLAFDRKSQSFLLSRQVTQGNKTTTEVTPFNGVHGELQARVEGVNARGEYSTRSYAGGSGAYSGGGGGNARGGSYSGNASGGSRGGSYSGGSYSGGGSHGGGYSGGGGGYSGGGGGSHSSGGGGGSSGGGGGYSGGGSSGGGGSSSGGSSGGGGGGHH